MTATHLPWSCTCTPHVATFHSRQGPAALVFLHHVGCDRPRLERRALVFRSQAIPAESLRKPVRRRRRVLPAARNQATELAIDTRPRRPR